MRLFQENTADYCFKMYANRRDWGADLRWNRQYLPIWEQNTAMGVVGLSGIVKSKMRLFIIKIYQKKIVYQN
jgi:hypothetical protein